MWLLWQVDTKPASDIVAGAVARAASQGTIHPLDTLKVRMQAQNGLKGPLSKFGKLVPPPGVRPRPIFLCGVVGTSAQGFCLSRLGLLVIQAVHGIMLMVLLEP
jgi:hypothetical protein